MLLIKLTKNTPRAHVVTPEGRRVVVTFLDRNRQSEVEIGFDADLDVEIERERPDGSLVKRKGHDHAKAPPKQNPQTRR